MLRFGQKHKSTEFTLQVLMSGAKPNTVSTPNMNNFFRTFLILLLLQSHNFHILAMQR